jgi:S-adenosyl methyltransferase
MADLPDFDTRVASPARVWNYWLGGKDHFAAARATRRFLVDAVTLLTDTYGVAAVP